MIPKHGINDDQNQGKAWRGRGAWGLFFRGIFQKHRQDRAGVVIGTGTCPWRHAMEGRHERTNGRRHGKGMPKGGGGGGGAVRAHVPCFSMNLSASAFRPACGFWSLFGLSLHPAAPDFFLFSFQSLFPSSVLRSVGLVFIPSSVLFRGLYDGVSLEAAAGVLGAGWYGWRVGSRKVSLRACNGVVIQ